MVTKDNPFTISFGREPINLIKRQKQFEQVKNTFTSNNPMTYTYVITGVKERVCSKSRTPT